MFYFGLFLEVQDWLNWSSKHVHLSCVLEQSPKLVGGHKILSDKIVFKIFSDLASQFDDYGLRI